MPCYPGPQGEAPDLVRRQKRVKGKLGQNLYEDFYRKGNAGQGKYLGIS